MIQGKLEEKEKQAIVEWEQARELVIQARTNFNQVLDQLIIDWNKRKITQEQAKPKYDQARERVIQARTKFKQAIAKWSQAKAELKQAKQAMKIKKEFQKEKMDLYKHLSVVNEIVFNGSYNNVLVKKWKIVEKYIIKWWKDKHPILKTERYKIYLEPYLPYIKTGKGSKFIVTRVN